MTLQIYNTLSRRKETFEPLSPPEVKMYVCGPTVYDKAHIGHAMSAIIFDMVRRYLTWRGYNVIYVMNFTDVDDKIILRAQKLATDANQLARAYAEEYLADMTSLHILPATINPRATEEIGGIVAFIEGLIAKGYAYEAEGDVYFRVRKDAAYGKLSHRNPDDMQSGARVDVGDIKEDPLDFALWKAAKPGEPFWPSPWGPGRPGWHIECSAMNLHHLGEQIDIHGGGNDLIFPHHENEIAQSESLTGKPFARYWMHNGMLQLRGEKMSKSLGNLITIEQFLKEHSADVLRLVVFQSNYRAPLTYSDDIVEAADHALQRFRSALKPQSGSRGAGADEANQALENVVQRGRENFTAAMDDDFNIALALSHLFAIARAINTAKANGAGVEQIGQAQATLRELTGVLGLTLEEAPTGGKQATPFIELLVDVRTELRKAKQWALADLVRQRLGDLGITLEDGPQGTTWQQG